jgi:hypothetical protein
MFLQTFVDLHRITQGYIAEDRTLQVNVTHIIGRASV